MLGVSLRGVLSPVRARGPLRERDRCIRAFIAAAALLTAATVFTTAARAATGNLGIQASDSAWTDISAISAGTFHTVGLKSDGTAVAAGIGNGYHGEYDVRAWTDLVAISAGQYHTVGLKSDGTVVAVGSNESGQCNVAGWTDIEAISAGFHCTLGLRSDGTVVAAGDDWAGASGWTDMVAISASENHSVGIKSDGTAVAVGYDGYYGKCEVTEWTDLVAVSAGGDHTVGLKSDGTVVAVGSNINGQCDVTSWAGIVAIDAGYSHTVGLEADGTVLVAGDDIFGSAQVWGWEDITAVSAADFHTVGLKSDGTVVAVGHTDSSINANVSPVLEYIPEKPAFAGKPVTFVAGATDADGGELRFSLGPNAPAAAEIDPVTGIFSWTPLDPGSYQLTVRVSDGSSGTDYQIVTIMVADPPVLLSAEGATRIETAIAASKLAFPNGATTAIFTTSANWPDALGGSALAGALNAPILLTEPATLTEAVRSELHRLGVRRIIILGGEGAVSTAVSVELRQLPGSVAVSRIAGADRYLTADVVAAAAIDATPDWDGTAFVATGSDFPDALGASPLAAAGGWPIYLDRPGPGTDGALVKTMAEAGVTRVIILGGTGAVPPALESALRARFGTGSVDRLAGAGRYETAVAVATYGVTHAGLDWDRLALATGQDFPDALAGGALQARRGSVLLLTPSATLHDVVRTTLTAQASTIYEACFLGGAAAVSPEVRTQVAGILDR